MSKVGLVLEGGGMRGLFTAGALDVWMEQGIEFGGIIGVSAGAAFGCNVKSHQPGRVIRYNRRFARDARYCSWQSLWRTGDIFGARFCYHDLPRTLDPFDGAAFEADPMPFYCVVTDCATGRAVYHRCERADDETFEWIRASASMPLVARPVRLGGREYLDGGLSDGIPLKFFEDQGFAVNVVVTTRPVGYRKFSSWRIKLLKPWLRRYPAVYRALVTRHQWYNATLDYIAQRKAAGVAFHLAPPCDLPIHRVCHDPEQMQRVYEIGRRAAQDSLPELRAFLASHE